MTTTSPSTIVLIHGLWMTPLSWEHWVSRYESRGYTVLAPAWPGLEAEVEALNADPSPIAALDVETILDHYENIIRALDEPPIIMGHSFGGAFTQLLVNRGLGAAAVAIASATVKGVRDLPLSTLKATMPVLGNPFNRHNAVGLDPKQFHYAFTNTLDRPASDEIWKRYHVPGSSRVLRQGAFSNLHRHSPMAVDFGKADRAPLLLIAFGEDHIIPPKASRHNAEKYHGPAVVEFEEFAGLPHFPGVDGWEDVADRALSWATAKAAPTDPLTAAG